MVEVKAREAGSPSPAPKFRPGDKILVDAKYDYMGMPQNAMFKFELGTGIYPIFTSKYAWAEVQVPVAGAMGWSSRQFSTDFTVPNIEKGVYSTRGTLRTVDDVTQEIDTDWSVLEIV